MNQVSRKRKKESKPWGEAGSAGHQTSRAAPEWAWGADGQQPKQHAWPHQRHVDPPSQQRQQQADGVCAAPQRQWHLAG